MVVNNSIEMAKRLIVDSIWKSAVLEGLGTTFPKTEAILENIQTNTSREEVMFVLNMRDAWKFLLNEAIGLPTSIALIREFNKIVSVNLFYEGGKIRTSNVSIGGTSWCPSIPRYEDIITNLNGINSIMDVELRALKYFCYIARTQMFIDGNKRVAQLVANKVLIENDKGIFQIPVELVEDFKTLLLKYYETGDDAKLVRFMKVNCIKRPGVIPSISKSNSLSYSYKKSNMELSLKQLDTFKNVLGNLVYILSSFGEDRCILYESGGCIYLEGRVVSFKMSIDTLNAISNTSNTDELKDCVIKTVKSMNMQIPININKIIFPVKNTFSEGIIKKSEVESGSSDVLLN